MIVRSIIKAKKYLEQVESVTSLDRGTWSERDLIPQLLNKCGYVLDGRYNIDNNGVENAFRPLALGRKNYLFCGNHAAAGRAAIVYSLFACCKAHDVEIRPWLEDTLRRLPAEKDITVLLPENWLPVTAK